MSGRVTRRRFIAGSAAAGMTFATPWVFADERPMPMRTFGRTGLSVSLAGLGCHPLGRLPDAEAASLLHRAIDLGINYIDTAPSYSRSEIKIGRALATNKRRDKVILATKTLARDARGAQEALERSLKQLRTDRIDVWQFHALRSKSDNNAILAKNGALAAGLAAQKAGKVRFLGITGHYDPAVFVDALGRHAFDTLLIPLNCIDPHHRSFEEHALPDANKKKTGVVAMKVFCSGRLPKDKIVDAEACLRYTYGLPISTCIVGCKTREELDLAAHVARNLKALSEKERDALRARTKGHSPGLEWYKR